MVGPARMRFRHADWRYPATLFGAFVLFWIALAVKPWYRQDWLLENVLVITVVPLFVATATRQRFSDFAYTLLFVFLWLFVVKPEWVRVPADEYAFRLVESTDVIYERIHRTNTIANP